MRANYYKYFKRRNYSFEIVKFKSLKIIKLKRFNLVIKIKKV